MITQKQIDHWFNYHEPTIEQGLAYRDIREAGRALANAIVLHTTECADQTAAIRKVREAVMTANAAVACGGK